MPIRQKNDKITPETSSQDDAMVRQILRSEWEDCPDCPNQGWYPITVTVTGIGYDEHGEPIPVPEQEQEQEQCEFCYTNPKSVFYQKNKLW